MSQRRLPDFFYNWMSMAGALLAAGTFGVIALLILIDVFIQETTLYLGLLTYCVLPGFLVAGLALVALGAWRERARIRRGEGTSLGTLTIDLRNPSQRNALLIGTVVGGVFLMASALGTYKAYHVTESTKFCGTLCHTVMKPEHTAYQQSAHARVECVQCHIGPGADWFVRSKLTGLYQVYATAFKKYPRPIPTPIKNLRPARDTCLQCHWPEKFFGKREQVNPHYLADEKNTPYPITLLLNIGGAGEGQASGIHWHMALKNKVEYIAKDPARQEIVWVRTTDPTGQVTEYQVPDAALTDEQGRPIPTRTMDCMDCHNRPSHNYRPPMKSVNAAMAAGRIPTDLPYIKREAVKALAAPYTDTPAALKSIEDALMNFYAKEQPATMETRRSDILTAVKAVQTIYQQNFFPEMKADWRAYPENLGHSLTAGCFRCHGSDLKTADGRGITKDCRSCHVLLAQGPSTKDGKTSLNGLEFKHPVDVGGMEMEGRCVNCHQGGAELY